MRMVHDRGIYHENWTEAEDDDFVSNMIDAIRVTKTDKFRIHVSGDFYDELYVMKWISIVLSLPDVQFFGYTRSWMMPGLVPYLELLRDQPNVELFASVDPSMPEPPQDWRVAYINTDLRFRGIHCPEQSGKLPSCAECGYCFRNKRGDVEFRLH